MRVCFTREALSDRQTREIWSPQTFSIFSTFALSPSYLTCPVSCFTGNKIACRFSPSAEFESRPAQKSTKADVYLPLKMPTRYFSNFRSVRATSLVEKFSADMIT